MTNLLNKQDSAENGHDILNQSSSDAKGMISTEFHKFIADIEDLFKATNLLTGEELTKAKAKLSERIATARVSVEGIGSKVACNARKTAAITNNYVHEQPWPVIGAGALIGVVLGYLIARRR